MRHSHRGQRRSPVLPVVPEPRRPAVARGHPQGREDEKAAQRRRPIHTAQSRLVTDFANGETGTAFTATVGGAAAPGPGSWLPISLGLAELGLSNHRWRP